MSFRDEEEALRARVREAEAARDTARDELEAARRDTKETLALRQKLAALEAEAGLMRVGRTSDVVLWRRLTGLVGVVGALGIGGLLVANRMDEARAEDRVRRAYEDAERRRVDADAEIARLEAEVFAHRAAPTAAPPEPYEEDPMVDAIRAIDALPTSLIVDAHVTRTAGDAPARRGERCSVSITLDRSDECRAQILCSEVALYPPLGDRDGGWLACEFDDARRVTSAIDENTSDVSGDPRLVFDRARGSVEISDGPDPTWSVSLHFEEE